MKLPLFLRSNAYKQGYNYGKHEACMNPFSELATCHNIENGLGGSPYFHTTYVPFLEWEEGRSAHVYDRWVNELDD